ncbi:putative gustatory receptor 28a [Musca vetustissima]|uniref:putative gustatory receptor 28a n=1 Tax=Musca vetustissima TaxID=27455 RepID=UPI002AB753A6|nr:putative gustatory receptor 28a [Musca vetustissima]
MGIKIWERLTQADNIFQSLRPLTYISIIGLAPFHLKSQNEVRTSALSYVAGISHFLFFSLCFLMSRCENGSIIGYFFQTNITKLGDFTLSCTGVIAMLTIFGFAIFKRDRLIAILQNNLVVDEIFVRLGIKLNYRTIFWYSFLMSFAMLLFNFIYLCVSYMLLRSAEITPSFVVFTTFALPHINISIMVFKFMCTTHLAKSRFHMLNEILQDILDSHIEDSHAVELSPLHSVVRINRSVPRRRPATISIATSQQQRYSVASIIRQNPELAIRQVTNIHNLLCDICNTIEEYFTYPLLAIIAISFLFILFDDYYLLEVKLNPNCVEVFEADEFFAFFITQMFWYVIIIVLIVEGSSRTIKESGKCAAIVHKILNITDDGDIRDRLLRLSLQLQHRRVRFTAAELFNLDRTLIFTMTGAATCYLIILVQFSTTHHSNPNQFNGTNCVS